MSRRQKIKNIILAFLYVICVLIMILQPNLGYFLVMAILSIALLLYGVKQLIYYFTMARHMVGGKLVLYRGMIFFDLGVFTVAMADIPKFYIMIYLMGGIIFKGLVDILRAFEKRKFHAGYKMKLVQGLVCVAIGVLGIVFSRWTNYLVYFYCAGLLYSAGIRIKDVYRKDTEIVTIAP